MTTTTTRKTTTIYCATAMVNGKPAGHVCYGRDRESCESKASRSPLPVRIRRERIKAEVAKRLVELGKL